MKQIKVGANEAGQRLDKLLIKILNKATKSFIYKMLRKKNIVLNGKKASGNEKLNIDDEIKIFLSDETFAKFSEDKSYDEGILDKNKVKLDIIYEDSNVLFINKKAGMLSQKDTKDSISLVEYIIDYMINNNELTKEQLQSFKPSVCNRLDRNTSGLIVAGKSLIGLQMMSDYIKNRVVDKYYLALVKGVVSKKKTAKAYLYKDSNSNKVTIIDESKVIDEKMSFNDKSSITKEYASIVTEYEPIATNEDVTLLKIKLITGKTHQIRAHLASLGHPLIGDYKYGDRKTNEFFKNKYNISCQLLHSYQMIFPKLDKDLIGMSEKKFVAKVPSYFKKIVDDYFDKNRVEI